MPPICVALASGTATLEAMLLHRPMVTFYKLNWLTLSCGEILDQDSILFIAEYYCGQRK